MLTVDSSFLSTAMYSSSGVRKETTLMSSQRYSNTEMSCANTGTKSTASKTINSTARLDDFVLGNCQLYELRVDMPKYRAEEISVTVVGSQLIINGHFEDVHPKFGVQSQELIKKYTLPQNVDPGMMTCRFREFNYTLVVTAPVIKSLEPGWVIIPVEIDPSTTVKNVSRV